MAVGEATATGVWKEERNVYVRVCPAEGGNALGFCEVVIKIDDGPAVEPDRVDAGSALCR